jgi:hypothetical protein
MGPASLTSSGHLLIGSSAGTDAGGQLNPELPRWLMRLPPEWASLRAIGNGLDAETATGFMRVVAELVEERSETGVFVGGLDYFKETTMPLWCRLAHERGAWAHVARVNSARRIALCGAAGADSFDGTSASMYLKTLALLDGARRQPDLYHRRPSCPS